MGFFDHETRRLDRADNCFVAELSPLSPAGIDTNNLAEREREREREREEAVLVHWRHENTGHSAALIPKSI